MYLYNIKAKPCLVTCQAYQNERLFTSCAEIQKW